MLCSGDFDYAIAIFSCMNLSTGLPRAHLVFSSSGQMLQSMAKKMQQLTTAGVKVFLPAVDDSVGNTLPIYWGVSWAGWGWYTAGSRTPPSPTGQLEPPPRCHAGAERSARTASASAGWGSSSFRLPPGDACYGAKL